MRAGAARRVVNPPLGTRQTGFRLFGNPVQAIERYAQNTFATLFRYAEICPA